MPSQFSSLDSSFPSFTGQETLEQKVDALYDYSFMLLENLRYVLRNLDWSNFSKEALENYPGSAAQNITILDTADNVTSITNQYVQEYTEQYWQQSALPDIQRMLDPITQMIESLEGMITQAETDLSALRTRMGSAEGRLTALEIWQTTYVSQISQAFTDVYAAIAALESRLTGLITNLINTQAFEDKVDTLIANYVIAGSVAADELYANYGEIADLVVKELRTDYDRVDQVNQLDYIHIHDEEINFITGTSTGQREQFHHGTRYFWWVDAQHSRMTSEEQTEWPVMVYRYSELNKGTFRFETVGNVKIPVLKFGAGDGQGNSIGYIYKDTTSMNMYYRTNGGRNLGVFIGDSYTDIAGLRRTVNLDFTGWDSGTFVETIDGNVSATFTVTLDTQGRPTAITDDEGHTMGVDW